MAPLTEKLSEIKPPLVCSKKDFKKPSSKIKILDEKGLSQQKVNDVTLCRKISL